MIIEYVLYDPNIHKLITKVNEYIKEGWEPLGGICTGNGILSSSYQTREK